MQVLKEELRLSIIRIARESFLEQGYDKTSMKDIALKLGVSVGNLYRYFPNKEALFEAVAKPAYDRLLTFISDHEANPPAEFNGLSFMNELGEILSDLLRTHRESLLILLYGSKGTSYEYTKEELVHQMTEHLRMHLTDYNSRCPDATPADGKLSPAASGAAAPLDAIPINPQVSRPLTVAFLEGYFEIIRLHADPEDIREMTKHYVTVWFKGLLSLM
ncbi:TetR/AcrR family transcriptional regulator [Paenibacillus tyrfis]|uniref:TetR/AcrR family transcriptional regulator n=1 Tax=Paenibacillus tyrfis TaxID=1501230 RepID=UPI00209DF578|nr:TetR/AcrR family transcriptional regulator [Paenibacillus tyrfis]MCP1308066.1 TetR/AcrR family transcriptional regulator [Paenibacillus tyrfis]